jgi:hypothetical protein
VLSYNKGVFFREKIVGSEHTANAAEVAVLNGNVTTLDPTWHVLHLGSYTLFAHA